ncbi:MAG: hypothetical protein QW812_03515 [Thermoplasmataceae archaeon]
MKTSTVFMPSAYVALPISEVLGKLLSAYRGVSPPYKRRKSCSHLSGTI